MNVDKQYSFENMKVKDIPAGMAFEYRMDSDKISHLYLMAQRSMGLAIEIEKGYAITKAQFPEIWEDYARVYPKARIVIPNYSLCD